MLARTEGCFIYVHAVRTVAGRRVGDLVGALNGSPHHNKYANTHDYSF